MTSKSESGAFCGAAPWLDAVPNLEMVLMFTWVHGITRYPFVGYEISPDGIVTKRMGTLRRRVPARFSFIHANHLDGVNALTDATGARVQLVEYDPWA